MQRIQKPPSMSRLLILSGFPVSDGVEVAQYSTTAVKDELRTGETAASIHYQTMYSCRQNLYARASSSATR